MNKEDAKMKQRYFLKVEDFLEAIESVGGSRAWDTWRDQTLEEVFKTCSINGLRIFFSKEPQGSPYDAE